MTAIRRHGGRVVSAVDVVVALTVTVPITAAPPLVVVLLLLLLLLLLMDNLAGS